MDTYEKGYQRFEAFVDRYRLFPDDRTQIAIAFSGGKDISLLCDFLHSFRERRRPDLTIELLTVLFPRFLYDSPDVARREQIERTVGHWVSRGFQYTPLEAGPDWPDSVLDGENPCRQCAMVIKPGVLARHIAGPAYQRAVYCVGLTFDDMLGWFIELMLLAGARERWWEQRDWELYDAAMYLATRLSCRQEVPLNQLLYPRPMMAFTDAGIRHLVDARGLPLIPEDCREVLGRQDVLDSPRRELGVALAALRGKYPTPNEAIFDDYQQAVDYIEASGLVPGTAQREEYVSGLLRLLAR